MAAAVAAAPKVFIWRDPDGGGGGGGAFHASIVIKGERKLRLSMRRCPNETPDRQKRTLSIGRFHTFLCCNSRVRRVADQKAAHFTSPLIISGSKFLNGNSTPSSSSASATNVVNGNADGSEDSSNGSFVSSSTDLEQITEVGSRSGTEKMLDSRLTRMSGERHDGRNS